MGATTDWFSRVHVQCNVDGDDAARVSTFVLSAFRHVVSLLGKPRIPVRRLFIQLGAPAQACHLVGAPQHGTFQLAVTCHLSDYSVWGQLCHQTVHLWDFRLLDVYFEGFAVFFASEFLPAMRLDWQGWEEYYGNSPHLIYAQAYLMMRDLMPYLRPWLPELRLFICEGSNTFRYLDFDAFLASLPPAQRHPLRNAVLRHAAAVARCRLSQLPDSHFICPAPLDSDRDVAADADSAAAAAAAAAADPFTVAVSSAAAAPGEPASGALPAVLASETAAPSGPALAVHVRGGTHSCSGLVGAWQRYRGLEDEPAVVQFFEGALRALRTLFGVPVVAPRCVHIRLTTQLGDGRPAEHEPFQRCDPVCPALGEFCIYLSRGPHEYSFHGQLAHEVAHLMDASVHCAYAEGLCMYFAYWYVRALGRNWHEWEEWLAGGGDPLYAVTLYMMRDVCAAVPADALRRLWKCVAPASAVTYQLDICQWLETLAPDVRERVRQIIVQHEPRVRQHLPPNLAFMSPPPPPPPS